MTLCQLYSLVSFQGMSQFELSTHSARLRKLLHVNFYRQVPWSLVLLQLDATACLSSMNASLPSNSPVANAWTITSATKPRITRYFVRGS